LNTKEIVCRAWRGPQFGDWWNATEVNNNWCSLLKDENQVESSDFHFVKFPKMHSFISFSHFIALLVF